MGDADARPPCRDYPAAATCQWPSSDHHRDDRTGSVLRPDRAAVADVEGAIENAKKALLHDCLSQSLERSLGGSGVKAQSALKDFRLIAKYL